MEPVILFAWLVGAVGFLHMLSNGIKLIQRRFRGASTTANYSHKAVKRGGWYVFFDWNKLVGQDDSAKPAIGRKDENSGVRQETVSRKQQRSSARRPALRVSLQ